MPFLSFKRLAYLRRKNNQSTSNITYSMKRIIIFLTTLIAASLLHVGLAQTAVEQHGWLSVSGTQLIDQSGKPTTLHGPSFGWHNYWHRFFNRSTVRTLTRDWHAQIIRCSIGLDLDSLCYDQQPQLAYACVDSIVEAAKEQGIYVIIDFHSHKNNLALAKEFFSVEARKYGHLPNVLFEIWNEPTEVAWSEIKDYALELLPIIRQHAPRSIVIVATPRWDQDVDRAADDPITGYDNLMYSLHFYAATHKDFFRDKARYAHGKGLPLFISECAAMEHTGDGVIDMPQMYEWLKLARELNLSWVLWSVSDKVETCSMLRPGTPSRGADWKESDIQPWGLIARKLIREAQ